MAMMLFILSGKEKEARRMFNVSRDRYLFYLGVAVLAFSTVFCICFFTTTEGAFYSCCWGVLGAGLVSIIARIALHVLMKDNSAEMWQVSIYLLCSVIGWLISILANSWAVTSIGIAIVVGFLMMAIGSRFISDGNNWVIDAVDKDLASLEEICRWKFIKDDISAGEDFDRPLCNVNGNPMTVAEARAQGYVAEAKLGTEYLKLCIKEDE